MGREARMPRGLNALIIKNVTIGQPTLAEFNALVAPYFKINESEMKALALRTVAMAERSK